MGLLSEGKPLSPEQLRDVSSYIREHGITQFLHTWDRVKDVENDELRFGDEIECAIMVVDSVAKTVKLSIRGAELRAKLIDKELIYSHENEGCTWHPEFGAWMIESTPSQPYTNYASDLMRVERNMTIRRRRLVAMLNENEIAPTVTCFPLLGVGDFIHNPLPFEAPYSLSTLIPDNIINPHPRFAALTANIRSRRGSKVDIQVPLFRDVGTPEFIKEAASSVVDGVAADGINVEPDTNIHMDAMGFGMGMCCLQVTFQGRDVDESRYMYDQLAILAPIMLAMTAGTPIFKGRLSDIDVRWSAIAQSVDDRTEAERGLLSQEEVKLRADPRMAGQGVVPIPKSRYDSISTYIYHCKGDSNCRRTFEEYNDIYCPVDEAVKLRLRNAGIDENLAHHLAHLFCRDPISAFEGQIELDDEKSMDHFESLQSTNWQTCRWKPPPPRLSDKDPHIGWRTEFRSMEVQLTDFENAAFTVFIVLITRVLLAFDLSLYVPLSKVDENMKRAHTRDAVNTQMFYFRKHIAPPAEDDEPVANINAPIGCGGKKCDSQLPACDAFEEMSLVEIFTGKNDYFPGLLPLVRAYLDFINCDSGTSSRINQYLDFIEKRASGQLMTPAKWMRRFVQAHPAYQQDSVISPIIACDLMTACQGIGDGSLPCPDILGDIRIERIRKEDAYGQLLAGRLSHGEKSQLLRNLAQRSRNQRPNHIARGVQRSKSISEGNSNASSGDRSCWG